MIKYQAQQWRIQVRLRFYVIVHGYKPTCCTDQNSRNLHILNGTFIKVPKLTIGTVTTKYEKFSNELQMAFQDGKRCCIAIKAVQHCSDYL